MSEGTTWSDHEWFRDMTIETMDKTNKLLVFGELDKLDTLALQRLDFLASWFQMNVGRIRQGLQAVPGGNQFVRVDLPAGW